MDISPQNAYEIVREISSILGNDVNLIDSDGLIIASTDPARVNTIHTGARRLVSEGLEELVVYHNEEYPGARKGLNLPVSLDGVVQGVIGITGDYDEVIKYGHVLKKMTEILLRENHNMQEKKVSDRIRDRFLDEWILEGSPVTGGFIERGLRLGLDAGQNYWVAVSRLQSLTKFNQTPEGQALIDDVNRLVRSRMESMNCVFSKTPNRLICLLPTERFTQQSVVDQLIRIDDAVHRQFGQHLITGFGEDTTSVHRCFIQADKALQSALRREVPLLWYSDVGLDIILDDIVPATAQAFLERTFGSLPLGEWDSWVTLLSNYYECEGSLQQTADRLYLHKNTLGARLDRFERLTHLNPRSRADGAVLQVAIELYHRQSTPS